MNLDFKPEVLSKEYVKEHGFFYVELKFSFESYWENEINHYERLSYTTENGKKHHLQDCFTNCIRMVIY